MPTTRPSTAPARAGDSAIGSPVAPATAPCGPPGQRHPRQEAQPGQDHRRSQHDPRQVEAGEPHRLERGVFGQMRRHVPKTGSGRPPPARPRGPSGCRSRRSRRSGCSPPSSGARRRSARHESAPARQAAASPAAGPAQPPARRPAAAAAGPGSTTPGSRSGAMRRKFCSLAMAWPSAPKLAPMATSPTTRNAAVPQRRLERPPGLQPGRHIAEIGPRAAVEGDGVGLAERRLQLGAQPVQCGGVEADELDRPPLVIGRVSPSRDGDEDRMRRHHIGIGQRLMHAGAREGLGPEGDGGAGLDQHEVGLEVPQQIGRAVEQAGGEAELHQHQQGGEADAGDGGEQLRGAPRAVAARPAGRAARTSLSRAGWSG